MRPMQCNIWTLLVAAAIMAIMTCVSLSGNIAVQTHKLATQNMIDEVKMNNEFKHVGGRVIVEETNENSK